MHTPMMLSNAMHEASTLLRLPQFTPAQAALAKLVSDRRLRPWLLEHLQVIDRAYAPAGAAVSPVGCSHAAHLWLHLHACARASVPVDDQPREQVQLRFSADAGRITLGLDSSNLPALTHVARSCQQDLACQAAALLIAPAMACWAQEVPGLELIGVALCIAGPAILTLRCEPMVLYIVDIEVGLIAQIASMLRQAVAPRAAFLSPLRLPARARVFTRRFRLDLLQSLQCGDIVLIDAPLGPKFVVRATLIFGTGAIMQAAVDIDPDAHTATLIEKLQFMPEDQDAPGSEDLALSHLSQLNLPVAFELDTARVELGDLASLGPGSVLRLEAPLMSAVVRLVCHGQVVGVGQLVALGEHLGVRIERMGLAQLSAPGA